MSRNGSGVYSLPAGNPVVTGTTISSSWANTTLSDIATALTGSVASDGQTPMTGNLQMGSNKVTGLAVATTSGDALSYGQDATVTDLSVTGNATVGGTLTLTGGLTLNGNVTVGDSSSDTLTVNATSTFAAGATFSSTFAANGGVTLGDASGDALTINSSAVSIPNGLNFDSDTFVIDATNNRVGVGTSSPTSGYKIDVNGSAYIQGDVVSPTSGTAGGAIKFSGSNSAAQLRLVMNNASATYAGLGADASGNIIIGRANSIDGVTGLSTQVTLSTTGNLGLGVTPSAWYASGYKAIQVNTTAALASFGSGSNQSTRLANNWYSNTSGTDTYITSNYATVYQQGSGQHIWYTAPSGTAGNAITFTQAMTLDASGNLGVGTTSSLKGVTSALSTATNYQFTARDTRSMAANVGGGIAFEGNDGTLSDRAFGVIIGAKENATSGNYAGYLAFYSRTNGSSPAERMRIDSSGNVGIGTSSPSNKLSVVGTSYFNVGTYATGYALTLAATTETTRTYQIGMVTGGALAIYDSAAAAQRLILDSSGNLGLGVTPSASQLPTIQSSFGVLSGNSQVNIAKNAYYTTQWNYTATANASLYSQISGEHRWSYAASGTAGTAISFTQAMTLDASGNLIVGATSASLGNLNSTIAYGGADAGIIYLQRQTGTDQLRFYTGGNRLGYVNTASSTLTLGTANFPLVFATNDTERARIDTSGNLIVAKTTTSDTTVGALMASNGAVTSTRSESTNASLSYVLYSTGASNYRFYVGMGGTVYATSTSISAISDASLKENVRDLETGLTEVMALKPRRFDWKNGDATNVAGFIAQEVAEVLPELVSDYKYSDTETKKSLKMGDILPTLVKAIQELKAEVDSLKAQLNK